MVKNVRPTNKYSISFDGERYYGFYDSKEDALAGAKIEAGSDPDLAEAKKVYIAMIYEYVPEVDAERVLEELQNDACDEISEGAEEYLEYVTPQDRLKLKEMLTETFNKWAKETDNEPNLFTAEKAEEFDLGGENA